MAVDPLRAKSLFLAASELPSPAERAAFLDGECGRESELRARVEALLKAHDGPEVSPDQAPSVEALERFPETEVQPPDGRVGAEIAGRYRLKEKIGEGGMGEVWVARQTEPVKRKVALKLIKAGMDSKAVLQRFEQERQALALMDHPNIAHVLDAGMTPRGQPFFVMELVNGRPLHKFCDEAKLGIRERLELFAAICHAVQHAHQKGIIHRDLKPGNILVTIIDGRPVPKVIDFGVAKAVSGKLTEETLSTGFGAVVGTLEYMSPEQANFSGDNVDTRADIYSLGVILYELLTGLRPIDGKRLKQGALVEMIRIIQEEEPSKPSTRLSTDGSLPSVAAVRQTDPKRLMALLRGELDWVVMRCLEKQRDRRYETASGLARDIQRYLNDEPVDARPPSASYRLQKFVRKNRVPVTAAALVVLALVAGIAGTTAGLFHARDKEREAVDAADEERKAKQREADQRGIAQQKEQQAILSAQKERQASDRAREVLDAMTSDVTRRSLTAQSEITGEQKKFLKQVLTYYKEFASEKADDEVSRSRTAAAAFKVAEIEHRIGEAEEAKAALRLARDLYADLVAAFSGKPEYRYGFAKTHNALGELLGNPKESHEEFDDARTIAENLVAEFPDVADYRYLLADIYLNWGTGFGRDSDTRETACRQALAICEKLVADNPASLEYRAKLVSTHTTLGFTLRSRNKWDEANVECRQALTISEKLAAEFPGKFATELLAEVHARIADTSWSIGRYSDAETEFKRSIAVYETLSAQFPSDIYRSQLAMMHRSLGALFNDRSRFAEAVEELRKALPIYESLAAGFSTNRSHRQSAADIHMRLGHALLSLSLSIEAEAEYRAAITNYENLATEADGRIAPSPGVAESSCGLGLALHALGKDVGAETALKKGVALDQELAEKYPDHFGYHMSLATHQYQLSSVLAEIGKSAEAIAGFRKSLATEAQIAIKFPISEHIDFSRKALTRQWMSHERLGHLLCSLDQFDEATAEYAQALTVYAKVATQHPTEARSGNFTKLQMRIAEKLSEFQKDAPAETRLREALETSRRHMATIVHANQGIHHTRFGRWLEAARDFDQERRLIPEERIAWFKAGLCLLLAGDREAYEKLCRAMFEQFRETTAAHIAESLCKTCLLGPSEIDSMELPIAIVRDATNDPQQEPFHPWGTACCALFSYRQGKFEEAIEWVKKDPTLAGMPGSLSLVVRAMAEYRLGQHDLGRQTLAQAESIIPAELRTLGTAEHTGPLPVSWELVFYDWLAPEILRREATALINGQRTK